MLSTTSPEPASASVPLMFIFTFRRDISFCSFVLCRIGVFTVIKYIIMPLSIGQHMKCVDVCVEGGEGMPNARQERLEHYSVHYSPA